MNNDEIFLNEMFGGLYVHKTCLLYCKLLFDLIIKTVSCAFIQRLFLQLLLTLNNKKQKLSSAVFQKYAL